MNAEELAALSYRDLQKLAKSKNLKARQPKEVLIKAILEAGDENGLDDPKSEALNVSVASSILTEDGKSEAETDAEEPKPAVTKSGKRKLSNSAKKETESVGDLNRPKRRRFAEFFSAPRTSSPIDSDSPKQKVESVMNVTIDLDKSEKQEEEEEIISANEQNTENANLNSTITLEKSCKKRLSNPRKSSHPALTPATTSKSARKSLLNIPLRKNIVGTPGSIRKARPSAPISTQKLALAAQSSRTPSAVRSSLALTSAKKTFSFDECSKNVLKTPGTAPRSSLAVGKSTLKKKATFKADPPKSQLPRLARKVPDFAKMHAEQFDKMETLNEYLQKKQERFHKIMTPGKSVPPSTSAEAKTEERERPARKSPRTTLAAVATKPTSSTASKPIVHSVKEANFNFGSVVSSCAKPFVFKAQVATPTNKVLHNITNSSETPGSASKKFNLKASLAKPLSYQPHKGKLKPWDPKQKAEERKAMASKVGKVSDRREMAASKIKGVRLNKRAELLLKRRNLEQD